jgi:hypothetical protein
MKRTPLQSEGKSPTALCKKRIQALLREIVILRDGGCVLRHFQHIAGRCFNTTPTKDGHLILQFDHLNSRAFSVSYADTRNGVCACEGHHGTWKLRNPVVYVALVREYILATTGGARWWAKVEEFLHDRSVHHMTRWDWEKQELALKQELRELQDEKAA